ERSHEGQVVKLARGRGLCAEAADSDNGQQRGCVGETGRKAPRALDRCRHGRCHEQSTAGARRRACALEPAIQRRLDELSVVVHETISSAAGDAVLSLRSGRNRRRAIMRRKRTVAAGMPSAVPTSRLVKPTKEGSSSTGGNDSGSRARGAWG